MLEKHGDESTEAIKRLKDHVAADEGVECLMLTVRDGMTLLRKR